MLTIIFNQSAAGPQPPNAPTALAAVVVSSTPPYKVLVNWVDNDAANELGFVVERSTTGGGGPWVQVATLGPGVTSYDDLDLTAPNTYTYRVYSFNAQGNSGYSNTASVTLTPPVTDRIPFFGPHALGNRRKEVLRQMRRRARDDEEVLLVGGGR